MIENLKDYVSLFIIVLIVILFYEIKAFFYIGGFQSTLALTTIKINFLMFGVVLLLITYLFIYFARGRENKANTNVNLRATPNDDTYYNHSITNSKPDSYRELYNTIKGKYQ